MPPKFHRSEIDKEITSDFMDTFLDKITLSAINIFMYIIYMVALSWLRSKKKYLLLLFLKN